MKKFFYALILLVFTLYSCEKDDICSGETVTTPRLVIDVYDISNPVARKGVTNLKVVAEGQTNGIIFNTAGVGEAQYVTNANTISLPLDVSRDSVTYYLTLNSGNANAALINTDTITINYSRRTQYVSRACGYSVFFNLNNSPELSQAFTLNPGTTNASQAWIQGYVIQNYNIANENETHVRILY